MNVRIASLLKCLPLLAALLPFAASCQSIAGIEEYRQGHCADFCDQVMANCTGANEVYHSRASCMGFCALLREGDFNEKDSGNTVACRWNAVKGLPDLGEAVQACQWAGPGGGDHCGESNCDNYCALFPKVCPDQASSQEPCKTNCLGFRDDGNLNATDDHEGDTIQCRLVHLSAATTEPTSHCQHARLAKPSAYCTDEALKEPHPLNCDDYCKLVDAICSGNAAVYEDVDQCKAVCKYFAIGEVGDQTEDTLTCRKYHTQNAIALPATHCAHAGPGGDGHCGDTMTGNCDSYCSLLNNVCPAELAGAFTDIDGCLADCADLPDSASNMGYSAEKTKHPGEALPFGCRLLSLSRAAAGKVACGMVLDETSCL
ncbi:MAG: hypothetical protein QM756_04255 [Polyangiaceae bacterium]